MESESSLIMDFIFSTGKFDTKKSQPETSAIINWLDSHQFVLSATLHGGTLLATYPFDSSQTPSNHGAADDAIFRHLASGYAKVHPTMHKGQPSCPGLAVYDKFPQGIAPGSKWKSKISSMKDYNYMQKNCFEVSIYLGCCKFPYANTLQNFWAVNKKPLIYYMYQVSGEIPVSSIYIYIWSETKKIFYGGIQNVF